MIRASYPVIDVDLHLNESSAQLARYCDLPWRRVLAELDDIPPPWGMTGSLYPRIGGLPTAPPPARTPADLLERMAELGIDAAVALPGPLLKIGVVYTADYCAALARAYNRWLTEEVLPRCAALYGAIIAVPHAPEDAAREIARYAGDGRVVAAFLPTAGVGVLWGERVYDPIYAAAEAANMPVVLHGAPNAMVPATSNPPTQFAHELDAWAMGDPLVAIANLTSIVGRGVLARYPRLRVVFLEAGISWLTHMLLRLDKEYNENRRDVPYYTDRVSHWIKRQVWVGTHPIESTGAPRDLAETIEAGCGHERVLYGSHWPHAGFDTPERVAAELVDDEARRKILGANARDLFGIAARETERL